MLFSGRAWQIICDCIVCRNWTSTRRLQISLRRQNHFIKVIGYRSSISLNSKIRCNMKQSLPEKWRNFQLWRVSTASVEYGSTKYFVQQKSCGTQGRNKLQNICKVDRYGGYDIHNLTLGEWNFWASLYQTLTWLRNLVSTWNAYKSMKTQKFAGMYASVLQIWQVWIYNWLIGISVKSNCHTFIMRIKTSFKLPIVGCIIAI